MDTTFHSDAPVLWDAAVDHNTPLAVEYDKLMRDPAYLNPRHPAHEWTKAQVEARAMSLYGTKPLPGGQPFSPVSFSAVDGSIIQR